MRKQTPNHLAPNHFARGFHRCEKIHWSALYTDMSIVGPFPCPTTFPAIHPTPPLHLRGSSPLEAWASFPEWTICGLDEPSSR